MSRSLGEIFEVLKTRPVGRYMLWTGKVKKLKGKKGVNLMKLVLGPDLFKKMFAIISTVIVSPKRHKKENIVNMEPDGWIRRKRLRKESEASENKVYKGNKGNKGNKWGKMGERGKMGKRVRMGEVGKTGKRGKKGKR